MKQLDRPIYLAVLFLLLLFSCDSVESELDNLNQQHVNLMFSLQTAQEESQLSKTRQMNDQDSELRQLRLFFFERGGKQAKLWSREVDISRIKKGHYQCKYEFEDQSYMVIDNQSTIVVAVANDLEDISAQVQNYGELQKLFVSEQKYKSAPYLMVAQKEPVKLSFDTGTYQLGALQLERLVSRIGLSLAEVEVQGFELVGTPKVRLHNLSRKTALLKGQGTTLAAADFEDSEWINLINRQGKWELPLFTVFENTSFEPERAMYFTLQLRFSKAGIAHDYYYHIPVALSVDGNRIPSQINRNTIYHVLTSIHELGHKDPSVPLELDSQVFFKDWTLELINYSLMTTMYLTLEETKIKMPNIADYDFRYWSSSPLSITSKTSYYYKYNEQGVKSKNQETSTATRVTLKDSKVYISAPVPTYFAPRYIEVEFQNEQGLRASLRVVQYPDRYVEVVREGKVTDRPISKYVYTDMRDNYPPGEHIRALNNDLNLYKIVSTNNSFGEFQSQSQKYAPAGFGKFFIGDPSLPDGSTASDLERNRLISPEFIVSSQYNYPVEMPQMVAKERCANYYEYDYGPGTKHEGKWRLPTIAEAAYIEYLQGHSGFVSGQILHRGAYWTANTDFAPFYRIPRNRKGQSMTWYNPYRNYTAWEYEVLYITTENRSWFRIPAWYIGRTTNPLWAPDDASLRAEVSKHNGSLTGVVAYTSRLVGISNGVRTENLTEYVSGYCIYDTYKYVK